MPGWSSASLRKPPRASAAPGADASSGGSSAPAARVVTWRSASSSRRGSDVASTCTWRESIQGILRRFPTIPLPASSSRKATNVPHSDPRNRAHPVWQDGRRPRLEAGQGTGRAGDLGRARALERGAGPGPAGDLRAGAAGRPGADSLTPGADRGRRSRRRCRRRRSTRSARRACARSASPISPFARASSRSGSPAGWSRCRTPHTCCPGARFGFRMGDVTAIDAMTHDGLTNPFTGKQMINEASEVSNELEITRPDMDRWAARSHQLAAKATEEGTMAEEIVPVTVKVKKEEREVAADEAIRPDSYRRVARQAARDRRRRRDPHRGQRAWRQRRRRGGRCRVRGVGAGERSQRSRHGALLRLGGG